MLHTILAKVWRQGLYRRIAVAFVALIALVLLAQAVAFVLLFRQQNSVSIADLQERGLTWTRAISADLGQALEGSPPVDPARRLEQVDVTRRVFVIFKDGRIVGSPPPSIVNTVTTDFKYVPDTGPLPIGWERSVYAAAPLRVDDKVIGVVGLSPRSILERIGPLIGAAGIVLLIGAIVLFSLVVVRPVRTRLLQLQAAARRLGQGDLDTRVQIDGSDEVAEVAEAFNSMAGELQRHTTALQTSDRLRRQLVADVSHELMTPLTAVLGHLETLGMEEVALDESERRRQVAIATREAHRLRRVIGDLLTTARYEAGGIVLDIEDISTRDLFAEIVVRHEHECAGRDVTMDFTITPDAEMFEADPFRIEQAIENVVTNALRHTPDGGRIKLAAGRQGDRFVIEVCDSGEGIPSEHLPHVFDRFYKASSARGIASPGVGLGLSIVKAIVHRHGGTVSASSEPGVGTIIRLELPGAAVTERHILT